MELKPVIDCGVSGNTTLEISHDGLRSLLGHIEAELLSSEVYNSVLASLQTMLGEAATGAELLVKAVSREAIRLAFQGFVQQTERVPRLESASDDVSATPSAALTSLSPSLGLGKTTPHREPRFTPPPPPPLSISIQNTPKGMAGTPHPPSKEAQKNSDIKESIQNNSDQNRSEASYYATVESMNLMPVTLSSQGKKKRKKLTKEQQAALALQAREERLQQIGQELQKARQSRSMSLHQLHSQTLVPLHHLEALEKGLIHKLPEDIYVRGFIRRVGDALGLEGTHLAASLPVPESAKSVTPSWAIKNADPGFHLQPVHLYIGYTALMAGAVSGVAWLSQQQSTGASTPPPPMPPAATSSSSRYAEPSQTPGLKSNPGGFAVGSDMAPPELIGC